MSTRTKNKIKSLESINLKIDKYNLKLPELLGDAYSKAKKLGNNIKINDHSLITYCNDCLEIIINEYHNTEEFEYWLDNITITYQGRKVYHASVHKYYSKIHQVTLFSECTDWIKKIL